MSSRIEVVETRRGRRAFVELARRFRGGSRYYVPQLTGEVLRLLDPDKNPIFRHAEQRLWIARDAAGAATGRIAASYDPRHAESVFTTRSGSSKNPSTKRRYPTSRFAATITC